jgi:hypothetical protein
MRKARWCAAMVVLALAPALTSCRLFRKSKPVPPPAAAPIQIKPAPVKKTPPPVLETPPEIPHSAEETPRIELPGAEQEPLPPPLPVKKRPSPAGPRAQAPVETPPPAPAAPSPQLRPIFTNAERQELERVVGERLGRAQTILAALSGKRLNRGQRELAGQIRTFIGQAEEARPTDLLRANNLAERAEVLAQDLARRVP